MLWSKREKEILRELSEEAGQTTEVAFSDQEIKSIEAVAQDRGICIEDAASQLVSEGLAKRIRRQQPND